MKPSFSIEIILIFVVIYYLVYKNQNYIFHQIMSKPQLYLWAKKDNNEKAFKEFQEYIETFGTFQRYFESLEPNKIHNHITPIFDKTLLYKKYDKNQFNPSITGKKDSLPYIINMFTTPRTLFGNWVGDSIFRMDLNDRGPNNQYKEYYMQALMKDDLENYRMVFNTYFEEYFNASLEVPYFDYIQEANINLTYLVHFKEMPTEQDMKDTLLFIKVVKTYAFEQTYLDEQLYNLQQYYYRTLKIIENSKNKECMVGKWLKLGKMKKENIFMEFIHNILGMAVNWTNLMYSYILEYGQGNITEIPDNPEYLKPYLYETIRYLNPVKFTTSKVKEPEVFDQKKGTNCMLIHDLKFPTRMNEFFGQHSDKFMIERLANHHKDTASLKGKCPFSGFFESPKGAKVPCGMDLYEKEGYIGFGEGYRRCPGEHLTLVFLEELAKHFKKIEFEIDLMGGKSAPHPYIWDFVDKNLVLKI
jgi:hypothetical protein